jgi:dihydrofolate synthase/folylpolyglutamate synthase
MRVLLNPLSSPQRQFRSVLIAGTNGKGSTAATLASILRAAGHRTGLYTSPHLVRINERIRVDGEPISDADFTRAHDNVEAAVSRLLASGALPWHPSFFEVLTAMAFLHFAGLRGLRPGDAFRRPAPHAVDIAVLEVGMGGRLDATNVVDPLVSVITDIALDHQKFLGHTVREIAGEKAGIIRPGGTVVTLPQHPEANDVIGNTILDRGARGVSAVPYVPPISPGAFLGGLHLDPERAQRVEGEGPAFSGNQKLEARNSYPLTVLGEEITVHSPLLGRHQFRNLALAVATAVELNDAGVPITPQDIERGIRETRWPGRFQIERQGAIDFVLDVAHNPAGAWALRSTLSQRYPDRPLLFVFGAMRDKAISEMAEILFPIAERVIATCAQNPRSASPEEVRDAAARTGADIETAATVAAAIASARHLVPAKAVVVITGSIYVVGEAMQALGIAP